MNRKYNLKLDLQFRCNNSTMKFNQFDNNTSDFFIKISSGGKSFDVEKALVVLATIKPSGKVSSQFVEVKNGLVYADLKPNMRDEIGTYTAQAMLILEDERVVTDVISYEVEEDKIFSLLNDNAEASEEFTLLTDMLSRLSTVEISEEQRMINEAERILSEENRKIEEAKRVEAELVRQHEEADRTKYDAIRESNENIRKQNESIRLSNETNRIDEEAKRVEEETKRVEAEQLRKDNYNFMAEDEERRRAEANAHKEAEVLRVQAETNRVNEEAKRRTTEQARVSAENTRVGNENTREANEVARQNNETKRVEAETQRQNRYNSFILDAEANANNFENYTNNAKVKEEERISNELDRKSQEDRRVSNEIERISNENTRKANEVTRGKNETSRQNIFENKVNEVNEKITELNTTKDNFISSINTKVDTKISELNTTKENFVSSINTKVDTKISELEVAKSDMTTTVSNKVNEVETRFNALTSSQQQSAEIIDARDGEISLKARLDRDIEKAKQVYVNVEGSHISTDSSVGYLKDMEILGNTIQDANNLADIRSVGDTVEGQELYEIPVLSRGKNLFNPFSDDYVYALTNGIAKVEHTTNEDGSITILSKGAYDWGFTEYKNVTVPKNITMSIIPNGVVTKGNVSVWLFESNGTKICEGANTKITFTSTTGKINVRLYVQTTTSYSDAKITYKPCLIEEGTQATPYEPYQEDKLTILSPVQLEKVGDVRDRIIEKDGVWGVEKNVKTMYTKEFASLIGTYEDKGDTHKWGLNLDTPKTFLLTNFLQTGTLSSEPKQTQVMLYNHGSHREFRIAFKKSDFPNFDVKSNVVDYLSNETRFVKVVQDAQFIPLPHDQQIKLRTFANKTNISFGCEIEGTIKAQVPKSLGATVNTHTEQIGNLNKELDRVKKLEESTVSTVVTESDFTTVEATSNGYFEDVKLEGKTLVNLCKKGNEYKNIGVSTSTNAKYDYLYKLSPNATYTIIYNINNKTDDNYYNIEISNFDGKGSYKSNNKTGGMFSITTKDSTLTSLTCYYLSSVVGGTGSIGDVIILEGDHTQNPPSYFEGLKSVGQDVEEISIESVNKNLFDVNKHNTLRQVNDYIETTSNANHFVEYSLLPNTDYTLSFDKYDNDPCWVAVVVDGYGTVNNSNMNFCKTYRTDINGILRISIRANVEHDIGHKIKNVMLTQGATPKPYTPHQSDKKRLLYYNNETQAWEKPILREWDSVEKHSDGKYYYHQRSGEVVLNGSENSWVQGNLNGVALFSIDIGSHTGSLAQPHICDKFKDTQSYALLETTEYGMYSNSTRLYFRPSFNISDLDSFKQWLQANNVTVVYQLAQEKVYECTNIDLITFANETNYIVESGVLSPKTTLKVHNNISNVVSLLQKKVSLLESNVKASQEVQDMMILETDMRMLDIELALMEFMPMTLNLGGSNMLRSATYFNFLKNHIINETYEKEYLENVMNKYLATGRINQDEYNELYKMLYPPVYDIELPIEY